MSETGTRNLVSHKTHKGCYNADKTESLEALGVAPAIVSPTVRCELADCALQLAPERGRQRRATLPALVRATLPALVVCHPAGTSACHPAGTSACHWLT